MACYFQIQLPGGEFIRIPSSVNILPKDEDLIKQINKYYSENQDTFHEKYKELLGKRFKKEVTYAEESEKFEELYSEQLDKYKSLINTISSDFQITSLNSEAIGKLIRTSNTENLIDNINNVINESVTEDSFEKSMKHWIHNWSKSEDKKPKEIIPGSLKGFLQITSRKVTPKYFEQLPFMNIVGKSNINEEYGNLSEIINTLENDYKVSATIQKNVKSVLSAISSLGISNDNILFGMSKTGSENDTLVIPPSELSKGFIFYNKNNELSLFLAVFKYLASSVNWSDESTSKLKTIISEWNTKNSKSKETPEGESKKNIELRNFSAVKFFTGEFKKLEGTDETSFKDASFHKMINEFSFGPISEIIDLVVDNLNSDKPVKLKEVIKSTFKFLNTEKYGTSMFSASTAALSDYDNQVIKNQQFKNDLIAKKYAKFNTSKERDFHYSHTFIISNTGEDSISKTYLELKDNIELGRDIIKVAVKEIEDKEEGKETKTKDKNKYVYVIPTKLSYTPKGIAIKGLSVVDGIPVDSNYIIKIKGQTMTVSYKKFETESEPISSNFPGMLSNASLIKAKDGGFLSTNIIKNYVQIGSYIKYINYKGEEKTSTVSGVYPGKIGVLREQFLMNYDKIIEINTNKLTPEDLKDWKEFDNNSRLSVSGSSAKSLPTKNDIVKFTDKGEVRINKVIDSDSNNVYIIINLENGQSYVEKLERKRITNALISFDRIQITNEIDQVLKDMSQIESDGSIRANKYSFSQNIEDARDGDILTIPDSNNETKFFKLLNKKTMKVVERIGLGEFDYQVQILDKNKVNGIYTTKDISGDNALNIIRINNRKINVTSNASKGNALYLIPKESSLNDSVLFDSLYFNIGIVIDKSEYENHPEKYQDYKNVTDTVLTLISRKLNKNIKGIYFESISDDESNQIQKRHIDDLFQISSFDKLSPEIKISAIQVGAYIRLQTNNSSRKIYRVSEDLGDNVMIEYSIFSPKGDIKTIRKLLSKSKLANSIKQFFLIKGNSKIQPLVKKVSQLTKADLRTKEEVRESFIQAINNVFKEANISIPIELVSAEIGKFKSGQKAKIQNGRIIINSDNSSGEDVVHEFLHVFLIGLKYSNPSNYNSLLTQFIASKIGSDSNYLSKYNTSQELLNLDKIEEILVDNISKLLVSTESLDISTIENLEKALNESFKTFGLDVSSFNISNDLYKILNTELKTLIGAPTKSKLYKDLLVFESNFRTWVEENIAVKNLEIKCN